jgi:ParB-like chromosome segregation protein Spo0J
VFIHAILTLLLVFSGCLFGGKKETGEASVAAQPGSPAQVPSPPPVSEAVRKETPALSAEAQELHDDIMSRLGSLDRDYQFLRDKVSMLEFLMQEASKESKKTKEEVRAELEKLRTQLSEYNALMLRILDKVSKEPKGPPKANPPETRQETSKAPN